MGETVSKPRSAATRPAVRNDNPQRDKTMMTCPKSRPQVSVCLPVYNGENYIHEAIQSVLEQTFTDFELIISDNASTDGTAAICLAAAAGDPRVHYSRAEQNGGLAFNHNR